MFYDESATDQASKRRRPKNLFRVTMIGVIIVLLAPLFMFAIGPAVLVALPLVLMAMAFMLLALVGGKNANPVQSENVQAWPLAPTVPA